MKLAEVHLKLDEHGRITDYRVLADTEAGQRIAMAALGRILRSERPGLAVLARILRAERPSARSRLKSAIMAAFCRGFMPGWAVALFFWVLRLRGA